MRRIAIICGVLLLAGMVVSAKQDTNSAYLCGDTASGIYISQSPCPAPKAVVTPQPTWVQDPSAGHYDCPDGWTEYSREEPSRWNPGGAILTVNIPPQLDYKKHVLNPRPDPGICVKDK